MLDVFDDVPVVGSSIVRVGAGVVKKASVGRLASLRFGADTTAQRGRLARLDFNLSFVTSTVVSTGNVASGVSSVNVHGITVRLLVVVNADSRSSLRRSDFLLELERALTLRALLL